MLIVGALAPFALGVAFDFAGASAALALHSPQAACRAQHLLPSWSCADMYRGLTCRAGDEIFADIRDISLHGRRVRRSGHGVRPVSQCDTARHCSGPSET
ncbi:MAG: hypothetical protein HPM95_05405 [Alphaproteobacteria bacterium]|nr:hypothetical protein [Alphaproteobacteria bacterium]